MIKLLNCRWNELADKLEGKKIYCFGSGSQAEWLSYEICHLHFAEKISAFVDNNLDKQGSFIRLDGIHIPIISFEKFVRQRDVNTVMLITSMYYSAMIDQMDREPLLDGLECYIEVFLEETIEKACFEKESTPVEKIPKRIHYCWFGKQDIPNQYVKYMESWKRFCPDYEIVRWDESNYDYSKEEYTRQAYKAGKWAFVSDYARLDIVYTYGGIYLDVDVEIVRNLDPLLMNQMFCGFEKGNCINTGLGFGAVRGFEPLRSMRETYENVAFINSDGTLNLTACTKYQTDFLKAQGLKRNGKQQLVNGIKVYPRTVLAPYDFFGVSNQFSDMTFTIHHYAATWFETEKNKKALVQKNREIEQRIREK